MGKDELIITIVHEHPFIYNKTDKDFKNTCKKNGVWHNIAERLRHHSVEMTAESIEKRWSALRDMFSREHRRQKHLPSGSGYEPKKEWELYRHMMFLAPYIAHRRTKSSLPAQHVQQEMYSEASTSSLETQRNIDSWVSIPIEGSVEESEVIQIIEDPIPTPMTTDSEVTVESLGITITPQHKRTKTVPELDEFAKRKKKKDDIMDKEVTQMASAINTAVSTVTSILQKQSDSSSSCLAVLAKRLEYVPENKKTDCLIELLQVVKKYEEHE